MSGRRRIVVNPRAEQSHNVKDYDSDSNAREIEMNGQKLVKRPRGRPPKNRASPASPQEIRESMQDTQLPGVPVLPDGSVNTAETVDVDVAKVNGIDSESIKKNKQIERYGWAVTNNINQREIPLDLPSEDKYNILGVHFDDAMVVHVQQIDDGKGYNSTSFPFRSHPFFTDMQEYVANNIWDGKDAKFRFKVMSEAGKYRAQGQFTFSEDKIKQAEIEARRLAKARGAIPTGEEPKPTGPKEPATMVPTFLSPTKPYEGALPVTRDTEGRPLYQIPMNTQGAYQNIFGQQQQPPAQSQPAKETSVEQLQSQDPFVAILLDQVQKLADKIEKIQHKPDASPYRQEPAISQQGDDPPFIKIIKSLPPELVSRMTHKELSDLVNDLLHPMPTWLKAHQQTQQQTSQVPPWAQPNPQLYGQQVPPWAQPNPPVDPNTNLNAPMVPQWYSQQPYHAPGAPNTNDPVQAIENITENLTKVKKAMAGVAGQFGYTRAKQEPAPEPTPEPEAKDKSPIMDLVDKILERGPEAVKIVKDLMDAKQQAEESRLQNLERQLKIAKEIESRQRQPTTHALGTSSFYQTEQSPPISEPTASETLGNAGENTSEPSVNGAGPQGPPAVETADWARALLPE